MKWTARILILALLFALLSQTGSAAELTVAGKSALLMDVATGTVLYQANPHEALAPASVTKIMTMLLIMEAVDSGKIALTDMNCLAEFLISRITLRHIFGKNKEIHISHKYQCQNI